MQNVWPLPGFELLGMRATLTICLVLRTLSAEHACLKIHDTAPPTSTYKAQMSGIGKEWDLHLRLPMTTLLCLASSLNLSLAPSSLICVLHEFTDYRCTKRTTTPLKYLLSICQNHSSLAHTPVALPTCGLRLFVGLCAAVFFHFAYGVLYVYIRISV